MQPEENEFSLSDLPKADWSNEDEVDDDVLVDIIRLAIGALSKAKHAERSKENPDQRVIERISEQQRRFSKSLREPRIEDVEKAGRLRAECLTVIRSASR
ncbi:hypothetical protein [Nocardiopsis sp. NRRL B-16309]|uniref:hypothetical protein n=1 Tax=Nocardiopsis sp. NRRL B-16309 TaxID=1519494 RepID=UPI0006AEE7C6|nr:hypothetical protein [Nocardiopsis sp. NRRL B-16309]KOX12383.1 hypothetical protein ADL05_20865 [Nocardiopsis sp. NRRL B-16309]